jgi:hypothetical protein
LVVVWAEAEKQIPSLRCGKSKKTLRQGNMIPANGRRQVRNAKRIKGGTEKQIPPLGCGTTKKDLAA